MALSLPGGAEAPSPRVEQLKMNLISNIEMIKRMYKAEAQLREELQSYSDASIQSQRQKNKLISENNLLRERVELLERILYDKYGYEVSHLTLRRQAFRHKPLGRYMGPRTRHHRGRPTTRETVDFSICSATATTRSPPPPRRPGKCLWHQTQL